MNRNSYRSSRILSVDPTHRGFGFVVLEDQMRLVDFGIKQTKRNRTESTLRKIADLIQLYQPDLLVVEDCSARGCRRGERVQELIREIIRLAMTTNVKVRTVSIAAVRSAFSTESRSKKHQIATVIARRFPELASHLPRPRKCYESENEWMAVFDAAAFLVPLEPE